MITERNSPKFTDLISRLLNTVRATSPLVHQITNYVTVNDCANIALAIGASPVMADDIEEVEDITAIASALVLNIGTLNQRTIKSMIIAGKKANEVGIPVIFDPVGAGASKLRNKATLAILEQVNVAVLRGNSSEISYVAGLSAATRGVDASEADAAVDGAEVAKKVASKYGCVTAITGAIDVISDGQRTVLVHNGHPLLSRVTGTGCMTTVLMGAFAAAAGSSTDFDYLAAATAAIVCMGVAGELAYEKAGDDGTGSFRTILMDSINCLNQETVERMAKIIEV